jgi:hypothetical protein
MASGFRRGQQTRRRCHGGFGEERTPARCAPDRPRARPAAVDHFFDGFSTADFNNDGHADVIVWQGYPDTIISVFFGDGRGRFSPAVQTAVPLTFFEGVIGELNGDGIVDLVFSAFNPAAPSDSVQMLWGIGDGTFRQGTRIPSRMDSPTVVDANRDGKMDIVGVTTGELVVWAGNGAGSFRIASTAPWNEEFVDAVELGDLNADGFLDVVTSSQQSVRVALGNVTGFGSPAVYPELGEPFVNWRNVAIADITLDGHPDLVSDSGSIARGLGDGTFAAADRLAYEGSHVHVADFTRDGLPDIIIATTDGAAEVIVNRRKSANGAPTVSLGADRTLEYAHQFADDPSAIFAASNDPDLHALVFEWRDANGMPLETFGSPFLEITGRHPGTYTFIVTARDGRGGTASDSINLTITPTREVVLWASNAAQGQRARPAAGEPVRAFVHRGSDADLQAVGPAEGRRRSLLQRLGLGAVQWLNRRCRQPGLSHRDLVRPANQPRGVRELWALRLGMGGRRVGRRQPERRDAPLPGRWITGHSVSDPRGRRVDRSGRAVVGEVPDRAAGLREKRRDDSDVDVPSGRVRWAAFCIGDFGLTIGD